MSKTTANLTPVTAHPGYLGSLRVVDALVRSFLLEMLEVSDSAAASRVVTRYAGLLAGHDPEHPPVEGWNTARGLGAALREHYGIDDGEDIVSMLMAALYLLALESRKAIRAAAGNRAAAAAASGELIGRFVNVYLGAGFALPKKRA